MSKMNNLAGLLDEQDAAAADQRAKVLNELDAAAENLKSAGEHLQAALPALHWLLVGDTPEKPGTREPSPTFPDQENAQQGTRGPTFPALSKEEVRGMLSGLAGRGFREEAKALVAKYSGGGSFSDIDPARYPELAEEVRAFG